MFILANYSFPPPPLLGVCVQSYYNARTDEDSESLPLRLEREKRCLCLRSTYKFHERQDRYHTHGVLAHVLFVGLESHGTL